MNAINTLNRRTIMSKRKIIDESVLNGKTAEELVKIALNAVEQVNQCRLRIRKKINLLEEQENKGA